jgi:hypothetical protein
VSALALAVSMISLAALAPEARPEPIHPLRVEQRVEPPQVKIGAPFTRTLAITHPREQRYELILPRDPGDFEVLEQGRRRDDAGAQATTTFSLRMAAFNLGTLALPPIEFEVWTADGARAFSSEASSIEVIASLPEDVAREGAELQDIRPPEEIAVPSYTLVWILLGAAAAAGLAYLGWRWWQRPRPAKEPSAPPQPLEVRTRQALRALAGENLPAQGRIKEFYVRLSEIVRGYVGERFGVEALECTSSELLAALRAIPAPGLPREALDEFLSDSDLVKFARARRSPDDCAGALDFAYLLVTHTTAPPLPTDAARRELS